MRIPFISLIAGSALALGGCAYGDLGLGGYGSPYYSSGYGSPYYGSYYGYPRSGISIGVGYGSGYGYGYPYYGGLGSPYGWYNNYYYPGTGYYVYDSYRRPYAMTTTQRQYWASRSPALRSTATTTTRTATKPNWSSFNQRRADAKAARTQRQTTREERRAQRRKND